MILTTSLLAQIYRIQCPAWGTQGSHLFANVLDWHGVRR